MVRYGGDRYSMLVNAIMDVLGSDIGVEADYVQRGEVAIKTVNRLMDFIAIEFFIFPIVHIRLKLGDAKKGVTSTKKCFSDL